MSERDPEIVQMQQAWLEEHGRKRRWIIVEEADGFTVHVHSDDSVAPASWYQTKRAAASRILQLLQIGPVAPQAHPEEACIGRIDTISADQPVSVPAGVEERARELLAQALDEEDFAREAELVRANNNGLSDLDIDWECALRAITAALREQEALRETGGKILWDRMRDRLRGHQGRRLMPEWKDALPEEREIYMADAAALRSLSSSKEG